MALIDLDAPPSWWCQEPVQRLSAEEISEQCFSSGSIKVLKMRREATSSCYLILRFYDASFSCFTSKWIHMSLDWTSTQEAREAAQTDGPVRLLTTPAAAGYHQNPIQIYFCEEKKGIGFESLRGFQESCLDLKR